MGFLDALLGRSRLPPPRPDRIFALVTAGLTIRQELGWRTAGRAGICLKAVPGSDFERARQELEDLVKLGVKETGGAMSTAADEFGFLWVIIADPDLDDQVNLVHLATQTLLENGFGPQLLAAVFRFERGEPSAPASASASAVASASAPVASGKPAPGTAPGDPNRAYLIYNYKRGNFYPFVPRSETAKTREYESELRAAATLEPELPTEKDQTRWFALWNCPI
ncbi:MAG TPA: hypothetical protein GXX55_05350 [Firmicutes bacterium]|nr:hypothetical protein [Bacillota bacterium]